VRLLLNAVGLLLLSLFALIFLVFSIAAAVKGGAQKEGDKEDMIKQIYLYLVLFVTLMMMLGGCISVYHEVTNLVNPSPYYQSFEDFKQGFGKYDRPAVEGSEGSETSQPEKSEEELRADYDALVKDYYDRENARAKHNLVKSLGWIIIPFPIFLFCQRRLVKKVESEKK
jgi:hypothetical protein